MIALEARDNKVGLAFCPSTATSTLGYFVAVGSAMPGMTVGYARTSTAEQHAGLEAQVRDLEAAGAERVFSEQVSSVARREQLDAALDFVRQGDTLIVTKPDRLARSTGDLLAIVKRLEAKGGVAGPRDVP